jgi:hypothetical protein
MLLLSLVFLTLQTYASGTNNGQCADGWTTGSSSCYLLNNTEVEWNTAWEFCLQVDPQSSLLVIESELENLLIAVAACPSANSACNLDTYWTAGTRFGWATNDTDGSTVYIDYTYEAWKGSTRASAGWTQTGKNNLAVVDPRTAAQWEMFEPTDLKGFVCEIPLDTCYTNLETARTTWARTTIATIANQSCPTGYVGQQYRECNENAQFLSVTNNSDSCAAVITASGWTDDTFSDGFAWNAASHTGDSHELTFGGEITKKFFIGDVDNSSYPYISFTFTAEPDGVFDGDVCIEIDGVEASCTAVSGTSNSSFSMNIGRELFGAMEYFDLSITSSGSAGSVFIYDLVITPFTRQLMAEDCYRLHSFNESVANPIFMEDNSGFLTTSDDLTFEFTIPRELYDIEIAFVGQANGQVGYTEDNRDYSHWDSDRDTGVDKCGRETWVAAIPWTDLTGVFTSVENFDNGTDIVGNNNEDYYVFTAVLNITAKEKLVAYASTTQRTWTLTREATWRYPFALKWQRNVHVDADLNVFVCSSGSTICTVRHVTAIISFVQTEVNPIADIASGEDYGKVVVGILTKVAYPYMFVSGYAHDDPPNDQISNSSLANYTQDSLYASWAPPIVIATPDVVGGVQQVVETEMAFQHEDTASCSHIPGPVEDSTQQECEQTWTLGITPKSGSCYVNGQYDIQFSARCMYGKAVCVFLQDNGKYQNGVQTTLTIKSTQMCPSLVENVDLTGYLCSTGRSQDSLDYDSECDSDPTYIQGETTHFKTEISSTLAAINKTEIIQIWAEQDYSLWNTQSAQDAGLIPRFDNTYNAKVMIWEEGDSIPAVNAFDDGGPTVDDSLLETIVAVDNSDSNQGFSANKAGFKVALNPYIFPSPHDRSTDIVFTVVLRATYQGFNEFSGNTGVLSGESQFGGSEDQSWCAGVMAGDYGNDPTLFCNTNSGYPGAQSQCPGICGSGRRNLRRQLQQDVVNGGEDTMQLTARVNLQPQKAEINGHVDPDSQKVRFTLEIEVGEDHISQFNHNRPLYYSTMEYYLGQLAAAREGQIKVSQITRIVRGDKQALHVTVDIDRPDSYGVLPQSLTPYAVAGKMEMVIQTGKVYDEDWFQHTEFYSMQYEAIDDTPDVVHFGQLSPVRTHVDGAESSVAAFSIIASLLAAIFMY